MGRITHLSISIARGASTSRCIHIDDTCLITLGWKPTSPPRLSVSFSCQNHSIRIEPKPGADAISTNISRTFGNRSNRPSLSLSQKTGIEQSFSTCSSFHPSNYRRIILVGWNEEVSSKVIQRKAASKIVGGKNEILPIVWTEKFLNLGGRGRPSIRADN